MHLALEEQKSHVAQLTSALEQERQTSSQLCQQAEIDHLSLHQHLQELQVQLETEQAKTREVNAALGRERELRTSADAGPSSELLVEEEEETGLAVEGNLLERLQRELEESHAQVGRWWECTNCSCISPFCFFLSEFYVPFPR